MNKIATRIHIIMLILLTIYENDILKLTVFKISNFPLAMYLIFCMLHVLMSCKNNKFKLSETEKKISRYLYWMLIVIVLSFFGLFQKVLSGTLAFDKSYIPKQTLFFFLFPIAISMYLCFVNDREHIEKIFKKYSLLALFVIAFLFIYGYCRNTIAHFMIFILSYYNVKNRKLPIQIITIIITIILYRKLPSSTSTLMFLVYIIFIFFNTKVLNFIQRKRRLFYLLGSCLLIYSFFNYNAILNLLQNIDMNSWWRFTYWGNEIRVLKKTLFLGVGYGSAYATIDIFNTLKGGFIDPVTGQTIYTIEALFYTGQHNSYMNVFYRTGIIGIILFLLYTFELIFRSKKYMKNKFDSMTYLAFLNANIIILFNVGLESPYFILIYYFATAALLSIRRTNINYLEAEKNEQ